MGDASFNLSYYKNGEHKNDGRSLNPYITIETFKKMVLNLTGGKKFFLKFNLDDDSKLSDLIKKTKEWNDKMRNYTEVLEDPFTLEIFTEVSTFGLWIEHSDNSAPFSSDV